MRCVSERERTIWPFVIVKDQIDVSFWCVCPVIDNEFCHVIVKVVCGSDSYFDNVMAQFMIKNRTVAWKTDVNLLSASWHSFELSLEHRFNAPMGLDVYGPLLFIVQLTSRYQYPRLRDYPPRTRNLIQYLSYCPPLSRLAQSKEGWF